MDGVGTFFLDDLLMLSRIMHTFVQILKN